MSLSKEHLPVASTAGRQPKCTRCRHHGIIVPQKGHVKSCPFVTCECWKCYPHHTEDQDHGRPEKSEESPD
ncbi:hypothetical protein KUCAC02_011536 [Chaenocephalus aceratus]|uniref:Uncharacterized protein n=1 Tax=Chaenocephalus aceratus TaxID=36190 RepID=A0ACB9WWN1_CHAAC|nr:hypothetical protein KUCAC02_011536 [Chaenocephalus aceratus]